jgi:signal transduction histidine kinase
MRFTLAGLLVVPLVSLVVLWAFAASTTLGNALHEHNYNRLITLSSAPTDKLVNQVAQERQQTFTWLSTDPRPPETVLNASRNRTSAAASAYRRMLAQTGGLRPASAQAAEDTLTRLLSRLPEIRASVDAETLSPAVAFTAYSNILDAVFAVYSESEQVNSNLSVDRQTDASMDAAQALEYASREAALFGGAAGAHGQMTTSERRLFANAVANQRLLIASALGDFDPQLRAPWQRVYSSPLDHQFATLENRIAGSIGSRAPVPVDIGTWQAVSRSFLGDLQKAQAQDGPPLAAMASRLSSQLVLEAALAAGVGLAAVLLSVFVLLRYGRRLNGELTTLRDTAQRMAGKRLPNVVERLRKGEDVDVDAESPPPPPGTITEIARVAQAFATVQRTAVQAAVGQANLRKGVNQVFLNLSLRNQSLLHRQLGMLDSMERATGDPSVLADLFRLDHLTTRMRRHAEGLIILSGSTPGRGWRDPVPVVDVLRAAIAEVEDYVRVDVASESHDAVVGAAVNDVIHLVAELIENATTFSPPATRVEVRADVVGNGFAVEIEDRGLGLTAGELTAINVGLASPPEFDLANSDQLGLFVVGQLAARHGIRVSLRESPYGGTTAIVLLPHSVIVRESESMSRGVASGTAQPVQAATPEAPLPADATGPITQREQSSFFSLTGRHRVEPVPPEGGNGSARGNGIASSGPDGPAGASWGNGKPSRGADDPWGGPPGPAGAAHPARGTWDPAQPGPAEPTARPAPGPALTRQQPSASAGTHRGLPRRVRQASIAPQLRDQPGGATAASRLAGAGTGTGTGTGSEERSPEETRNLFSSLQQGWQRGRVDDLDYPDDDPQEWPGGRPGPDDGEAQ